METNIYIPWSLRNAGSCIRHALKRGVESVSHREFVEAWCSVAYLFPGLHPDGFEDDESGWPRVLKAFAEVAWRRAGAGRLSDDELYCSDAQWAGLYDRMFDHQPDETERRLELARVSATYAAG